MNLNPLCKSIIPNIMKTKLILFFLIGILSISCKNEGSNIGIPAQPEISIDNPDFKEIKKDNYSIKVHKDWMVDLYPVSEIDLYIYMDLEDEFTENINLLIRDLGDSKMTLDEIVKNERADLETLATVISSERIVIPNKEYQRIVMTSPFYGESLKFIQHYVLKDSRVYVLTFTSLKRDFNQYEKIAEQIMQSFKVN